MKILAKMNELNIVNSDLPTNALNESYTEIFRLAQMCTNAKVYYELTRLYDGWIIMFKKGDTKIADAIQHNHSYGHEQDLLETMGFKEDYGDVTGYVTAEEVFEWVDHLLQEGMIDLEAVR